MRYWGIYRLLLSLVPPQGRQTETDLSPALSQQIVKILRRHRCVGASLCLFDANGAVGSLAFGNARQGMKATSDTLYRTASISKFAVALCAMKLQQEGRLSLDADVNGFLPFSLRHPQAPDTPITLRMLLTHTAGLHDGKAYAAGLARGDGLSAILAQDSFCKHLPGEAWEYSNLGAGIAGIVLEAAMQTDFEQLMQDELFRPLDVEASFYPQGILLPLADAYQVLPPQKAPRLDGAQRQERPLPASGVDAERHYAIAHGNLCLSAGQLVKLGIAGMVPGFLEQKSLDEMRRPAASFGKRARNLSQGIGTFILRDSALAPRTLYGHQGMAYGAVHALFFDPAIGRGFALLTSGASLARRGVLADLNAAMIQLLWSRWAE